MVVSIGPQVIQAPGDPLHVLLECATKFGYAPISG